MKENYPFERLFRRVIYILLSPTPIFVVSREINVKRYLSQMNKFKNASAFMPRRARRGKTDGVLLISLHGSGGAECFL